VTSSSFDMGKISVYDKIDHINVKTRKMNIKIF